MNKSPSAWEIIQPSVNYFRILNWNEARWDFLGPVIISLLSYYFCLKDMEYSSMVGLQDNIITFLSIFIGFSLTCQTIMATGTTNTMKKLRATTYPGKLLFNRSISFYKVLYINFAGTFQAAVASLTYFLIVNIVYGVMNFDLFPDEALGVGVLLVLVVIFQSVRSTTNLYHAFFDEKKEDE